MDSNEIARLRELCAKATPGPWRHEQYGTAPCYGLRSTPLHLVVTVQGEDDAAFIAAARTALPALLDDVERLQGELAPLRALLTPDLLRRAAGYAVAWGDLAVDGDATALAQAAKELDHE